MQLVFLFCILLGLVLSDPEAQWKDFKSKYGKKYESTTEETKRKNIYLKNQKMIDEHNFKFSQGLTTYSLAMNNFGDLEPHELMFGNNNTRKSENTTTLTLSASFNATAPTSIDWRELGKVTSVKDQKQCGSSWAFAANAAVESAYLIKNKGTLDLSEQDLVDCTNNYIWGNSGCNGGDIPNAFNYMKNLGVNTESYYPYTAKDGPVCRWSPFNVGARVTSWYRINSGDEIGLMNAVGTVGPVAVVVNAWSFQFYSGGMYEPSSCSSSSLNHEVVVVGYGSSSGHDYWIVKNSWGTTWGQKGYIYMARNKNNLCGIASYAHYPIV